MARIIPSATTKRFIGQTLTYRKGTRIGNFEHTPAPVGEGEIRTPERAERERNYERPAAAVAAAVAAAAFLAAFAAVEALRRRLVFGGVAGASPINSATMMLVTNNLGP